MLQKTWFERTPAGRGHRGHSTLPLNMSDLNATRLSYKKSLANLKRVMQASCLDMDSTTLLRRCCSVDVCVGILSHAMQRNTEVIQEMTEGRQLDVGMALLACVSLRTASPLICNGRGVII